MNAALDALLKTQSALWRGRDQYNNDASISTGFDALDNALPGNGWSIGCLTELLCEQQGVGELSLLLPALQRITTDDQWAALINPPFIPYAPALANAGIKLNHLLIVDCKDDADTLWACEQVLRAGVFAAVIGWVGRSTAQKQRRLQLAAEAGRAWATVYRPGKAKKEHSPAAIRIAVKEATAQQSGESPSERPSERHDQQPNQPANQQHLQLSVFKSRGKHPGNILINPAEFDVSQGIEWPGVPNLLPASALTTLSV